MLDAVAQAFGLYELRGVHEEGEILRISIGLAHVMEALRVSRRAFLVALHHGRKDISVFGFVNDSIVRIAGNDSMPNSDANLV
jgi:hypothetical protein